MVETGVNDGKSALILTASARFFNPMISCSEHKHIPHQYGLDYKRDHGQDQRKHHGVLLN